MFRTCRAAFLVACCTIVALTGCTASVQTGEPTISKESLEQGIADALQKSVGQRPDAIECPGSVKAKAGETTRCVLSSGSARYGLTANITSYDNGSAHYQVQVDEQRMN